LKPEIIKSRLIPAGNENIRRTGTQALCQYSRTHRATLIIKKGGAVFHAVTGT
jgi:hypothetical protein